MNKQRRRVWSILHTVADLGRCHDGTATVIQFDSDGRPTVRIALSLRAIRMHRPRRLHVLQFAIVRSALGRIHKRDASANTAHLSFDLPRSTDSTFYQPSTKTQLAAESFLLP
jgi:hypothetical protein